MMLRGNSSGTIAFANSHLERGHEDHRGTKPWSMSTWRAAWRPAVKELASLRVQSSSLRISQEVEILTGCVWSLCPTFPSPFFAPAWTRQGS